MMNSSAILQTPANTGSIDARRSPARQAGRSDESGSAFPDLLSKLKATVDGESEVADVAEEAGQGTAGKWLLDLLKGQSDSMIEESSSDRTDLQALMQALGGGTATADDVVALLARMTQGSGNDAAEALAHAAVDNEAAPEQAILTALTKLSNRDGAPAQEDETIAAILTVLRRETHLAPAQTAAASSVHGQWVGEVAQQARQAAQAVANGKPGDATPVAAQRTVQPNGGVQMAAPGLAVVAAEEAGLGTNSDSGGSTLPDGQAGADALLVPQGPTVAGPADVLATGAAPASVAHQLADHVLSEASALTPAGRPDIPAFVKHESPMKVLNIQLQPADLGTVTIRMSVKDNALRLDLEAGRGETVRLIQRDQDALSTMLRSAGYLIDGMEVRLTDQVSTNSQSSMGQGGGQGQGGQSGSSQQDTRSWGERHSREQPHNPFSQRGHGDEELAGRTAGRGGVYI